MNKGFFTDVLASRPLLWEAMLRANSRPASASEGFPDASALPGEAAAARGCGVGGGPAGPRRGPGGQHPPGGGYAEESRRLALLDRETLAALCLVAGVALHAPEIACALRREDVLTLRSGIGEDMYRYALCRGRYQLGSVRRLFAGLHPSLPLAERCALHGSMAPRLVAALWPEELAERFLPSLPPLPGGELPSFSEGEIREIWNALKKLLLKEVAPSWAPCFK